MDDPYQEDFLKANVERVERNWSGSVKKGSACLANPLKFMVPRDRIELPTRGFSVTFEALRPQGPVLLTICNFLVFSSAKNFSIVLDA